MVICSFRIQQESSVRSSISFENIPMTYRNITSLFFCLWVYVETNYEQGFHGFRQYLINIHCVNCHLNLCTMRPFSDIKYLTDFDTISNPRI